MNQNNSNEKQVILLDHPVIKDKLNRARDKDTESAVFRRSVEEVAMLMTYECTKGLSMTKRTIETPVATAELEVLKDNAITLVSILRAGNGLLEGMLKVLPNASVGHVGMARNPDTFQVETYYYKVPQKGSELVIVVDPMLATANTAIDAVNKLKQDFSGKIIFVCLVASPEGIEKFHSVHADIAIYTAAIDERLNDKKYIVPGIGDAGDRIYGTN